MIEKIKQTNKNINNSNGNDKSTLGRLQNQLTHCCQPGIEQILRTVSTAVVSDLPLSTYNGNDIQ